MPLHDIAFYAMLFFLVGVFLAGSALGLDLIIFLSILLLVIFLVAGHRIAAFQKKFFWLAGLSLFIALGAFYFLVFKNFQIINTRLIFNQKIEFKGMVVKIISQGEKQESIAELQLPFQGKILVIEKSYPQRRYGDLLNFQGEIFPSERNLASYLEKEGVMGISNNPQAKLIARKQGSLFRDFLFSLRDRLVENFQAFLPAEKASFLAGLTLGDRREFSREFQQELSRSGTTHLVALSGYNISILAIAARIIFRSFLPRVLSFWLTLLAIFGFVAMTGAEASVARAALMGGAFLLAQRLNRVYDFRNAITIAAFLMVLFNPFLLRFDVGFQLSFLALLGIVYLLPAIKEFLKIESEESFLGWKNNLLTTLSAQLAVLPVLLSSFGSFSVLSLLANVLILEFVPLTMAAGFVLGFLGFFSYYLSLIFSGLVNLFLSYELFIISFFSRFNFSFVMPVNFLFLFFYYLALISFIFRKQLKNIWRFFRGHLSTL